jgi:hypothetical protein
VPAGTRPPSRASRRLERALRLVDAGPRPCYRAALGSAAVTSVLAMAIAFGTRPAGPLPGPQRDMIIAALAALCLSAVLLIASLASRAGSRPAAWLDRVAGPADRAAIWLAFAAWVPFLLIVVYFRAEATFPPAVRWLTFGYDDKRWISATYLLGTLGPLIALTTSARVLTVGRGHPPSWRAWFAGLFPRTAAPAPNPNPDPDPDPDPDPPDTREAETVEAEAVEAGTVEAAQAGIVQAGPGRWRRSRAGRILTVVAGLATAFALAWYFLGPPWYLSQNTSAIGAQEDIFLTGFQAIASGHLPYIGVAGVQYGPGTQLASYLLMRHVTSFSLVGFRQAWAVQVWAGASILFAVFFLALGYARGLAASLLSALVYPALHQIGFQPGGSFDGFWGWANPLRYAGLIALVLLLPGVVRRSPSWRGAAAGAAIGVLWGVTSYLAQENLIAGAAGALLVGVLLLVSGTSSWRAVRWALGATLAGFAAIWVPILAFYAAHGDLGQFLRLYFLLARAMAQGFGNSSWQGVTHQPSLLTTMFYALPFLLAVLALLTVFDVRPVRIAAGWSRERVLLATTLLVSVLLYQGALLRSDTADLTGTLLTVPALVVMAVTAVPRLVGARRRATLTVAGAVLAVASFALLPYHAFAWTSVRSAADAPYLDRQRLAADSPPGSPTTLAASRVGAGLDRVPLCCQGSAVPMTKLVALMNRIHAIVGDRTAYVADFPHGYPGLVYFLADLTPAPVMADKYMTILNEPQLTAYMAYFQASVLPATMAVLTADLGTPEARFFLRRYAGARRITLDYDGKPYYVLLRRT